VPEPTMGREAYHRERELALAASPEKKANYERYKAAVRTAAAVDYLPVVVDIENVSRCNFHCIMCPVSDFWQGKRADDMPLEYFKRFIDDSYGLVEIKLHGAGEPLLGGKDFFEMVRYARARHIWVRTVTNASMLHVADNYRSLVDSDINEIQISVDGADEETFEQIRLGSNFRRVTDNCRLINRYGRDSGKLRTKMWTMVQKQNQAQLEKLVELGAELGFSHLVFSLQLSNIGQEEWRTKNAAISVEETVDYDRLIKLVDLGAASGVKVAFWNITNKYLPGVRDHLCPWPFERAYITSDMRVTPCCYLFNPDTFELTSIDGFNTAWHSADYAAFRQDHLDGRIPAVCANCYKLR
jgi:MoaA/NifB/PqqE/SkfB family radical SAM enzyme